jgi:hypothetical protein
MTRPLGLLFAAETLDPALVKEVLDSQDAPAWDHTVFQVLREVDLPSLIAGEPTRGRGTAVALSSSGWWFRGLDDIAARLASLSGQPVLAVFEHSWGDASGFYLGLPGGDRHVQIFRGPVRRVWAEGISILVGLPLDELAVASLDYVVGVVMGDDSEIGILPPLCVFSLAGYSPSEQSVIIDIMGTMLVAGACWKPGSMMRRESPPPSRMRVIALNGPVRLPGPPRWAVANRHDAIVAAYQVMESDGWVCLAPQFSGVLAKHGAAVELLQFAPFKDGRWIGVLHPWRSVRIGSIYDGRAEVEPVPQDGISSQRAFEAALEMVLHRLGDSGLPVRYTEQQLRASPDPAALLAWQLDVSSELGQTYLASRDPTVRLEVLSAILLQQPDGHGHLPT